MSDFFWDPRDWDDEKTEKVLIDELPKSSYGLANCTFHYWIKYVGLRQVYYYCQYCNVKKPENKR